MLIRIFSILVLFVFGNCSSVERGDINGEYESKHPSFLTRLFYPFCIIGAGTKLHIERDSTFYLETCSSFWNGRWKVKRDTLVLTSLDGRNKDSSRIVIEQHLYRIKENGELYRELLSDDDRKVIDALVKHK